MEQEEWKHMLSCQETSFRSQVSLGPQGQELPLAAIDVSPTQCLAGSQQTSIEQVGFPLAREVNFCSLCRG